MWKVIPVVIVVGAGFFFFQAEDGIRDLTVTGVQTCALPIFGRLADAAPTACQAPDPHPHAAGFVLPPAACDTHVHVFGWPPRYPFRTPRRYTPAAAGLAEYRHVLATLGIARAVIVQPDL